MNFPPPTDRQAKVLWASLTVLAAAVMLVLLILLGWAMSWVLDRLSPVLWPLAIATIFAYLLDPIVDFFESRKVPRQRAVIWVFLIVASIGLMGLAVIVPRLVAEVSELVARVPSYTEQLWGSFNTWLSESRWGIKAQEAWRSEYGDAAQKWLTSAAANIFTWLGSQLSRATSWVGMILGLVLTPIFVFYFLLEKESIAKKWTDYLPLRESKVKKEIVFVLSAINDYLIAFFRGQVLVALCVGALLTIGFLIIGLDYALLIGMIAGILTIVPYLGVTVSIIPAMVLAGVQFGDWLHPFFVLVVFVVVQMIEGFLISPKIIGDRVGMHPLTVIIALLVGTTLLGGLLGGVLAIPLAATLRVLMFRYVWRKLSN